MAPACPSMDVFPKGYDLRPVGPGERITDGVCRWRTDIGDVAVKTFAAADRALGKQEAELLAFLGTRPPEARYRTQTLIPTASGAPSADLDGGCVIVTRWEAGVYRTYDTYSAAEWTSLGASLAALHQRLDEMTTAPLHTLRDDIRQIDGEAHAAWRVHETVDLPRHPEFDAAWLARYLGTCRDMFSACMPGAIDGFPADDPQQPIHNDYNQFNYLFNDTLPPLILDWEASIGAPREFEVVRCLNHLPLRSPAMARSFFAGYLAVRPLRADRMPWAVDVCCVMHATKHWIVQGWIDGLPGFDERLRGAMEVVSMLARARESLADFFIDCIRASS